MKNAHPLLHKREFTLLQYPAIIVTVGMVIFYSQILFNWWSPQGISHWIIRSFSIFILIIGIVVIINNFKLWIKNAYQELVAFQIPKWLKTSLLLSFYLFFAFAAFSALKPAHRFTEGDFLDYHLFIPKQNWLWGNWQPIDWHTTEFVLLMLDNALSFLWISLPLLNRFPQFLIQCFLALNILWFFTWLNVKRPYLSGFFALLCFFAFRSVVIQVGTAMLDLINLYFAIGVITFIGFLWHRHNLGNQKKLNATLSFIFGMQLTAYFAHKSFGIIYFIAWFGPLAVLVFFLFKQNLLKLSKTVQWKWFLIPLIIFLLPHIYRSYYYTGDPIFPVIASQKPTACQHPEKLRVRKCEDNTLGARWQFESTYKNGWGHDLKGFLQGFVRVALPDDPLAREGFFFGRNRADYPVGLFWYFTWFFAMYFLIKKTEYRRTALLAIGVAFSFYIVWFMGSQQGRWLYPSAMSLSLFFGYAIAHIGGSKIFHRQIYVIILATLVLAININALKILFAQKSNLTCLGASCLQFRPELFSDYNHHCTRNEVLKMPGRYHLGYLTCKGMTPREDFPWLK